MSYLNSPHFHDEEAAYAFVESRVWADGRVCPHCGVVGKSGKLGGESTRMDRLWLSGMNRTRPMILLIGSSSRARRPVVHQGRYSPPEVSLLLGPLVLRLGVLPLAPAELSSIV